MHLSGFKSSLVYLVLLIVFHSTNLYAQASPTDAPQRVAVLTLKNKLNSHQNEINYLTAMIRGEVARQLSSAYLVMTEENIISLLPANKPLEDCVSDCQITLGREIGASYIITGELVRFGQSLRLFILLHNTRSGRLISNEIAKAKTLEGIEEPTQKAVARLLDKLTENRAGIVKVKPPKSKQEVTVAPPQLEKKTTPSALPALSKDQAKNKLNWSFIGEFGVTQYEPDDINDLSFGLGMKHLLNDYFQFGINLHYGRFKRFYYASDNEEVDYTIKYLNILPTIGYYFTHQAWTIYAEFGLGFAFGSKNILTISSDESSGISSLNLMLGSGVSFQLSQTIGVGLNIRYLSMDVSGIEPPTFFQNTLYISSAF